MNTAFKAASWLLALALLSQPLAAEEYKRNGRACLEELCLGDGLEELARIQWDVARDYSGGNSGTRATDRGENHRIEARYRGNLAGLVGYFADSKFDNAALPLMANVTAACETQYVQGTYTTASGNPTKVIVSLAAAPANPSLHRWQVRNINRSIPSAAGSAQSAQAKAMLEARYTDFTIRNRPRTGATDLFTYQGGAFTLAAAAIPNEAFLLRQHPACGGNGGTGPVNID